MNDSPIDPGEDKETPSVEDSAAFDGTFDLDHSVERVWGALTDAELLVQWLFPNDLVPDEGARFGFDVPRDEGPEGRIDCVVRHVDPYRSISYTWVVRGPSRNLDRAEVDEGAVPGGAVHEGIVTFDLDVTPYGRTRLRIRHMSQPHGAVSMATACDLAGMLEGHEKLRTAFPRPTMLRALPPLALAA